MTDESYPCPRCRGEGWIGDLSCPDCGMTGRRLDDYWGGKPASPESRAFVDELAASQPQLFCPDCGGSGYASTYDGITLGECGTCAGDGAAR